jgi:hypothetical protein
VGCYFACGNILCREISLEVLSFGELPINCSEDFLKLSNYIRGLNIFLINMAAYNLQWHQNFEVLLVILHTQEITMMHAGFCWMNTPVSVTNNVMRS